MIILNLFAALANADMPAAPSTPFDKTPFDEGAEVDESYFALNAMKERDAPGASTLVTQMYPTRSYLDVRVVAVDRRKAKDFFADGPVELNRVATELNLHDLRPDDLGPKLKTLLTKYYIVKVSVTGGTVSEPPRAASANSCANAVQSALREFLDKN